MSEVIIERAGLDGDLIPSFIVEYLYGIRSADIDHILTHLDFKIGGAVAWRHCNDEDDLFRVPSLQKLIHERRIEKAIDYINERFKAVDNTSLNEAIMLARIYKVTVEINGEFINHYALVHNVG